MNQSYQLQLHNYFKNIQKTLSERFPSKDNKDKLKQKLIKDLKDKKNRKTNNDHPNNY